MYVLDPKISYTMPTCGRFREPRPWESGGMRYGRITAVSVSFLSDPEAVGRCLFEPFRPDAVPLVTICAQKCEDVDWLAGHGYNLVGVDVAAVFDGNVDRGVHGGFCVVMWENMCEPIIGGREHSGVPKIFADIEVIDRGPAGCHVHVSRFGHRFMEFSVTDPVPLDRPACDRLERARKDATWMCYKYIPSLENDGPDVSYATVYPSSGQCSAAWNGKGAVKISRATPRQAPTQSECINLLAELPVKEIRSASVVHWNDVRALDRLPRRLR
jgi:acetoacetate decarboxylase